MAASGEAGAGAIGFGVADGISMGGAARPAATRSAFSGFPESKLAAGVVVMRGCGPTGRGGGGAPSDVVALMGTGSGAVLKLIRLSLNGPVEIPGAGALMGGGGAGGPTRGGRAPREVDNPDGAGAAPIAVVALSGLISGAVLKLIRLSRNGPSARLSAGA